VGESKGTSYGRLEENGHVAALLITIRGGPGRTGYLADGHMSKHMLIGGINALPYSSHMPTMYI